MKPLPRRNTHWHHGRTRFEIPPLDDYIGPRDGFFPITVILDPEIGEEVILIIRDQTPFMDALRQVEPFRLMMKNGCARNDYGPVVFFLFWVENPADPGQPFGSWDCYLDPKNETMTRIWRTLAAQTHWHLFLVGEGGRQENFFEFENNYRLAEALDFFDEACRNIQTIDFNRARYLFMDQNTLEDLFNTQPPQPPPLAEPDIYKTDNPMLFEIAYDDIQSGDITSVLSALNGFLTTRERAVAGRGRVTLMFAGYDDDPRDVYDVPEIRRYARALDDQFPYWFYFADPQNSTLKVLALCLCRIVKVPGGSTLHRDDYKQFIFSHLAALNQFCDTFALGDDVNRQATDNALASLAPPGVPGG
jgi:hypothetical protein